MKRHRAIIVMLSVSVCALWLAAFAYLHKYMEIYMPEAKEEASSVISVDSTIATTQINLSGYQIGSRTVELLTKSDLVPISASVDVAFIDQNPELPTGCEITSLTEVLNYYGFDVDKEYMVRNYLPMSETAQDGCFINYYLGSPWKTDGSGCFAPAIMTAANNFLSDKDSSLQAVNISYSGTITLFKQIADGYPVIVWTSFDYDITDIDYTLITYDTGGSFYWPSYEHCVVLTGYDLDRQTVTFADPTYGIVEHSIEDFNTYYEKFFYQAVVIR